MAAAALWPALLSWLLMPMHCLVQQLMPICSVKSTISALHVCMCVLSCHQVWEGPN
jgi:hypothetical protein